MKIVLLLLALSAQVANADGNVKALKLALDDEYKSKATYLKVIEDFGDIRPFSNIVKSEQRHIEALLPFFKKYSMDVPENPYIGNISSYSSVKEACLDGIKAEEENVKLYDKIFSMTTDTDLVAVFKRLQWASQERHLRAFQRCVDRKGRGSGENGWYGKQRKFKK